MAIAYEMDLVSYKCDKIGTIVDVKPICHYVHVIDTDTYKSVILYASIDVDNDCFLRMINWCAISQQASSITERTYRSTLLRNKYQKQGLGRNV